MASNDCRTMYNKIIPIGANESIKISDVIIKYNKIFSIASIYFCVVIILLKLMSFSIYIDHIHYLILIDA